MSILSCFFGKSNNSDDVQVDIENNVFRLHYKVTVGILIVFSLIINFNQYFGKTPISCKGNQSQFMSDHCWLNSYISSPLENPEANTSSIPGIVQPGIEVLDSKIQDRKDFHHSYQWVGFCLLFQAMFFFIPHYIWKYCLEGSRLKSLVRNLTDISATESGREAALEEVECLWQNLGVNQAYTLSFIFCEFLNFVNVIAQIVLTNWFLSNKFISLGFHIFKTSEQLDDGDGNEFLHAVFPKQVKCKLPTFGPDGRKYDNHEICWLPFNIFIEKVYVGLWFWFSFLFIASALRIVFTLLLENHPPVRNFFLQQKLHLVREMQLKLDAESPPKDHLSEADILARIGSKCQTGDWFLLYQLGRNLDGTDFGYLLKGFAQTEKIFGALGLQSPTNNFMGAADGRGRYEGMGMCDA